MRLLKLVNPYTVLELAKNSDKILYQKTNFAFSNFYINSNMQDTSPEKKQFLIADIVVQLLLISASIYFFALAFFLGLWQTISSLIRIIRLWKNVYFRKLLIRYWIMVLVCVDFFFIAGHFDYPFFHPITFMAFVSPILPCIYYLYITIRLLQFENFKINNFESKIVSGFSKAMSNKEEFVYHAIFISSIILISYFAILDFVYHDY